METGEIAFVNAADPPNDELVKAVYAHYGLCIYLGQVFETELINALTALETAASKVPTRRTFDVLYAKHETLTFGNLIRALSKHNLLPAGLAAQVTKLKAERDVLAHRFFRDHHLDFMTVGGCLTMIEQLELQQRRFDALDASVSAVCREAFKKIGLGKATRESVRHAMKSKLMAKARARYSSPLR
jgi:hypothetical protein